MKKNYPYNIIRLRKGKKTKEQIIWIICILNKKKTKSLKIIYKLGYLRYGYKNNFMINCSKLAFFLNKGYQIKKSVKKLLSLIIFQINKKKII